MNETKALQYRFKIDAFSVETLPMFRLAEYMAELAKLLGEHDSVHFSHLESGSAVLVSSIEQPATSKVVDRLVGVRDGSGPKDAMAAFTALDTMLAKDNAEGTLTSPDGAQVIPFPGRNRPKPARFGPFRERGTLDGTVIRIGGRDETVPVHLMDGNVIFKCNTSREISKRLAEHYLGAPLRVHGDGKWVREEDGHWELLAFSIEEFEVLDDSPLIEVIEKLQAIEGGTWADGSGEIIDLVALRRGNLGES